MDHNSPTVVRGDSVVQYLTAVTFRFRIRQESLKAPFLDSKLIFRRRVFQQQSEGDSFVLKHRLQTDLKQQQARSVRPSVHAPVLTFGLVNVSHLSYPKHTHTHTPLNGGSDAENGIQVCLSATFPSLI